MWLDTFMKEMRLARKIIHTLFKDQVQYPDRLIADTFSILARCGVLLCLYWYVFKLRGGLVNGTPYITAAWSIFFYFAFSVLRLREVARVIMRDVRSGTVEVLFNKPISYLPYRAWWQIGTGLYPFVAAVVVGSIALTLIVGIPGTMRLGIFIPTLLLTTLSGAVLSILLYSIVGLCAFWLEEINPLFWITDKTVMILGGSFLPVALFPDTMYKLARYSPFGATQFLTHTVYPSWQNQWPWLIATQLIWIAILLGIVVLMSRAAHRKVSINGG